ncbi:MAG: fibronectin type III domain-containing protein, partial [Pseudomonadota bacterium]
MRIAVSKQYRWVLAAVLACYAVSAASSNRSAAPVEKAFSANRLPVSVLTLLLADANGPTPAVPTTNGPSGSITLLQPSFSWSPSASATSYRLTVTHGGTTDFSIVYAAGAAACADESGACSVTPAFNFISGTTYSWSIQAINAAGYSAASTLRTFTTNPVTGGTSLAPLAFTEKPFGSLMLVDTIDTALVAPDTQSPALVSSVQTIAGRQSRTLVPGPDARYMTYRIGAGKGLVAKQAYVLDIEYPDDVPRAMFIANRGADFLRGFTTGSAVGDSRKSWTHSTLESLNYPQSGGWKNYHSLFYLHERFTPKAERNSICALRPLLPADGFDVSIFQTRKLNDPRSNGAAVGKIRLYKVVNQAALPAAITYPGNLPRRHLFWREEMADEAISNNDPAKRATVNAIDWFSFKMDMGSALGFNTVGKDLMEWGANQGFDSGDSDWIFNAKAPRTNIWAEIVAQASSRGLYLMPYLEYGGSLGNNCLDGQSCDTSVGSYKSMGFQRRTRKLFHGIYGPGTALDWYTTVSWAEEKSADLTDPDTETDLKMVLDKIIVQYKNNTTSFAGVWLRMRQTKLP